MSPHFPSSSLQALIGPDDPRCTDEGLLLAQSPDSDASLFQKDPFRHTRKESVTRSLGIPSSSQTDTYNEPSEVAISS